MTVRNPTHRFMVRLFVLLSLVFIALLALRVWQRRQSVTLPAPATRPPVAEAAIADPPTEPVRTVTMENRQEEESLNISRRPASIPGDLHIPTEARQALRTQTRQLLNELRDQPTDPDQKRALVISEEDIRRLESEGRMIY